MQSCKCLQLEQNRQDEREKDNPQSLEKMHNSTYYFIIENNSKKKKKIQAKIKFGLQGCHPAKNILYKDFMRHFQGQLTQCRTLSKRPDDRHKILCFALISLQCKMLSSQMSCF